VQLQHRLHGLATLPELPAHNKSAWPQQRCLDLIATGKTAFHFIFRE
jgi:hypothetical protein